jgi:hypothetical protein
MFEETVTVIDADLIHLRVRLLNQISGPTHVAINTEFTLAERDGVAYLSSKLQPDVWIEKPWNTQMLRSHPIIKLPPQKVHRHVTTSRNTTRAAKSIGLAKLTQYDNEENNSSVGGGDQELWCYCLYCQKQTKY